MSKMLLHTSIVGVDCCWRCAPSRIFLTLRAALNFSGMASLSHHRLFTEDVRVIIRDNFVSCISYVLTVKHLAIALFVCTCYEGCNWKANVRSRKAGAKRAGSENPMIMCIGQHRRRVQGRHSPE